MSGLDAEGGDVHGYWWCIRTGDTGGHLQHDLGKHAGEGGGGISGGHVTVTSSVISGNQLGLLGNGGGINAR